MIYTLLNLVLILFIVAICVVSASPVLNDDVLGLIVFKADLKDPNSKLASWNEDDDSACGWTGVECSPRTGRVDELRLDGFSISGKVGRGLLQLQFLERLSLSRNNLSGALNAKLSQLESLQTVDLSENGLSGSIPDDFFKQCRSLRAVSLANNGFTGELPTSIGSCSSLIALNLSSNRLSGPLPYGLWNLYGLRSLDLSGNSFVGEVPKEIHQLYNLRFISLRHNRLSGWLPDDIGGCFLLKSVDFGRNKFTGSLPATMQRLAMLNHLSLDSNKLSGEVPTWIGDLKSLHFLDLSNNWFSGLIENSIGNLQLLERLDLSRNGFDGSLPESIGACRSLLDVNFSHNNLSGNLPSWIFELALERVSVAGNKLNGMINVSNLDTQTLRFFDLSANAFSGEIPASLGKLQFLEFVNFSSNVLSGIIPSSIPKIKTIQVLDLSNNQLNGSIPVDIGEAISLKELKLQKNFLTGKIPVQIGNCSSLMSLILSKNNLTGEIPSTLANLTNLQVVDLSFNKLTGTLVKQLSDLPHLRSFNVSHNLLFGDLPAGNFFDSIPLSSISDNPGICGSVINVPCPAVLPKPIVLNPNSSSSPSDDATVSPVNLRHKKIILSISALVAIGAAAVIALGIVTITILNMRVRSIPPKQSEATLTLSDGYYSNSPETDANSGKLVMFTEKDPEFSVGTHAILNKDCELGRGGFGTVYKTILSDGRPVAIKKLTVSSLVKSQDYFEKEVKKLGKLKHVNLVALEGYYWTSSLQLLIYEFISGGNLYNNIHDSSSTTNPLLWQDRFSIILGIARSLAYLHRLNIIHYNLKSSNILIDASGEAKVGDYGLAKLLPILDRYVLSSKIQSSLGYMAPEFACQTVKITEKCDVYAFGVLVLEIVTGRRPVEYMEDDVVVLSDSVRAALEQGVEECVDQKLAGKFPFEEAIPVIKLGLICTSQVPSKRPDMDEVVNILELIRGPQDICSEELR